MLRSFHGSVGIHQCLRSYFRVGTSQGRTSSPLPGRLAGGCRVKETSSSPLGPSSPVVHRSGDCHQLGKVRPTAVYSSSVSWHDDRHVPQAGIPIPGPFSSLPGCGFVVPAPSFPSSMNMVNIAGPHGFSRAFSLEGPHLHAASPVATEGQLISGDGRPSQSYPLVANLCRSGTVVASGGAVHVRCSTSGSAPVPVVVNQRISVKLGGPSG